MGIYRSDNTAGAVPIHCMYVVFSMYCSEMMGAFFVQCSLPYESTRYQKAA